MDITVENLKTRIEHLHALASTIKIPFWMTPFFVLIAHSLKRTIRESLGCQGVPIHGQPYLSL